jgi:hypothetical protein
MAEKDVTNLVERLEAFEDRLGVSLEGLFAFLDENGYLTVNGEVHVREGTELDEDIEVVATVYDSSGRVLSTSEQVMYSGSFFAFEAFSFVKSLDEHRPAKIRVYPKNR